ncbi:MAG: 4Fe-4S binding protein [Verrucomicrobiales bacterium]|nr:4Fe-4S binding protein [Verrucomicrobiales bacterium]
MRPLTFISKHLAVLSILLVVLGNVMAEPAADVMNFPQPEFTSGYDFPLTTVPEPTSDLREWIDVGVLFIVLSIASWLAVKRRSRRGLFWVMVFSLGYFGFYKQGCVCPIGSIQNVALSLFDTNYAVPMTVTIFFVMPLVFALLFGRVFCSSVCALGAIQDLVVIKPIQLPKKLTMALSMIPYVYLGLAILFAATKTGFIICRYDPFIGFFRLNGNAPYLYLGAGFLIAGTFIARPYCRFFCPYGVLLGFMSRFAWKHLTITPSKCIDCRLCEVSCPFDYIEKPNTGLARENRQTGVKRLGLLFAMMPVMIILGGWIGHRMSIPLSSYNNTVFLAEQVLAERINPDLEETLETQTYRSMGTSEDELMSNAIRIRKIMNMGGWVLGGFLGLVFSIKLIGLSVSREQKDYEVIKPSCFSCGRCCSYCPSDDMHRLNFMPGTPTYNEAMSLRDPVYIPPEQDGKGDAEGEGDPAKKGEKKPAAV